MDPASNNPSQQSADRQMQSPNPTAAPAKKFQRRRMLKGTVTFVLCCDINEIPVLHVVDAWQVRIY